MIEFIHKMRYRISADAIGFGVWILPDPYTKEHIRQAIVAAISNIEQGMQEMEKEDDGD